MDPVILPSIETPTLTKADLAELLFERLGLNKRESKDMVEAYFEIIHDTLVKGGDVKLSGFGNFNIRPTIGNGYQYLRVAGAVAADNPVLVTETV